MGLFKKKAKRIKKDYSDYPTINLKEEILKRFVAVLKSFEDNDIYVISFYVEHEDYDPRKPLVYFGYNTEAQVKQETGNASSEDEARWNFAFWLQNELYCFGLEDDTADLCRAWAYQQGLTKDESSFQVFVDVLVEVVKDLHRSNFITQKMGREIPIIIHELEYYPQIAEQNIEANGKELIPSGFLHFCGC